MSFINYKYIIYILQEYVGIVLREYKWINLPWSFRVDKLSLLHFIFY